MPRHRSAVGPGRDGRVANHGRRTDEPPRMEIRRLAHRAHRAHFRNAFCTGRLHPRLRNRTGCAPRGRTRERAASRAQRRQDHQGTRARGDRRHQGPSGNARTLNPRRRFSLRGNSRTRPGRDSRFRRRPAQRCRSAAGRDRIQRCIAGAGRSGSSGFWNGCGWRGCSAGACPGVSRLARRAHDARVGRDAVRDAQRHLPAGTGEQADGLGRDLRLQRRAHDAPVPGIAPPPRLPEFRSRHRR